MKAYTSSIIPPGGKLEPITNNEIKGNTVAFEALHILMCYFLIWFVLWSQVPKVVKKVKKIVRPHTKPSLLDNHTSHTT